MRDRRINERLIWRMGEVGEIQYLYKYNKTRHCIYQPTYQSVIIALVVALAITASHGVAYSEL